MDRLTDVVAVASLMASADLSEQQRECATHGAYTSKRLFRSVWSSCPACDAELDAAHLRKQEAERIEREQARAAAILDQTCIPRRFIGRTFDTFNAASDAQRRALNIARSYAESFTDHARVGAGLVLSGLPGTGKSHLAGAILQAILPAHIGLYATCLDVIRAVRATWRRDSERSEGEVLNDLTDVALLVIDEVGVQYGTEGEQTVLFDVLDRRYREQRPTILLTNQDKKGFKEFIGERSYDRLTETSRWVPFDWQSHRPQMRVAA
jgi:DNA replication protein DnaC